MICLRTERHPGAPREASRCFSGAPGGPGKAALGHREASKGIIAVSVFGPSVVPPASPKGAEDRIVPRTGRQLYVFNGIVWGSFGIDLGPRVAP